jgi:thiol-disulfide isomerase/thioredoxin
MVMSVATCIKKMSICSRTRQRLTLVVLAVPALLLWFCASTFAAPAGRTATLYYFWGEGCPVCEKAKPFIEELEQRYPNLRVKEYEVMEHQENVDILLTMARNLGKEAKGVPTFFIGGRMIEGFSPEKAKLLEEEVRRSLVRESARNTGQAATANNGEAQSIDLPLIGRLNPALLSLPLFTLVIAGLDSFNPCAFFVLFFLLSLLIHAHSRRRMAIIGGTFVFFSGLIYFLFMAAWLNLFLLVGQLSFITAVAGSIALVIAVINIKDFFYFRKGVSLTISEAAKPRLFERMRGLLRAGSLPAMVGGTVLLAVAANSYEILCTAGFPMVFTRVLTLHSLTSGAYYLYLVFYNVVYVIPLAVIVAIFTITLGSRKLTERQGRVLKLLSGVMMLFLGLILLIRPSLLNNAAASVAMLVAALVTSWLVVRLTPQRGEKPADE